MFKYIASFLLLEASTYTPSDMGIRGGFFFYINEYLMANLTALFHMLSWHTMKNKILSYTPFLIFIGIIFYWGFSAQDSSYDWQWQRAFRYILRYRNEQVEFGPLLQGLGLTLRIVGVSLILSILLGLGTAILRYTPLIIGGNIASAYVGLVRNTPLLIQLFVMYFVFAPMLDLSPFWAAVWALALFEGAYMAEVFRAGIGFVPKGQWDAAYSLGFSSIRIFIYVVIPQTIRRILPSLTNQVVSLIKDSALVSAIALPDLTMQAQVVISETFLSLELWVMVAAIYVILTLLVTIPAKFLERHYSWQWV